ncbi:uncharacterized protein LOC132701089 [Cylas formicarius]|uniref:uncharacterized protein LOC132701089 n=1 Tax=Cylas formicarius TaxID=197179 RepID=UPI002958B188|nr:uncharacterized protein LOC132701089 [Cylas formicarius]
MWRLTIVALMMLIAVAATESVDSPVYSAKYANVHYQPDITAADNEGANKTVTNDGNGNKTELNFRERHREEVTEHPRVAGNNQEVSTEPESEQINFARIQNRKIKSDKLQEDADEVEDAYELADLNQQGVYYIYHPDGVLQKVVYATRDSLKDMEYSAEVNYRNVEPIVEPIYTYDPSTFVLQRLRLINT